MPTGRSTAAQIVRVARSTAATSSQRRAIPSSNGQVPGYGFYEVLDSEWPAKLADFNRHAFPPERDLEWGRHFFIGCHDGSGQFLAQELSVEVFDDPYPEVVEVAVSRMLAW